MTSLTNVSLLSWQRLGLGAGIGALQNGLSGAAVGAGMGALASIDDISMAKKQKKSLKQQKILLAEYQKNFTEEGKPINAKVDHKPSWMVLI